MTYHVAVQLIFIRIKGLESRSLADHSKPIITYYIVMMCTLPVPLGNLCCGVFLNTEVS